MTAYYNEIDPYAAQWLRNLIAAGHIAPGVVDERSIEDVRPDDLRGFTQCHFFAGIGVWSHALRRAGVADSARVWTGSCPCQPFSAAGKGDGFADERHLWPAWLHLISQCEPERIYGEQVASKAVDDWIDLVQADMEALGYPFAAIPFPSAGVGAPHIRDRCYWVADANGGQRHGVPNGKGCQRHRPPAGWQQGHGVVECCIAVGGLEDTSCERRAGEPVRVCERRSQQADIEASGGGPTGGFWNDAEWVWCRDEKWRPVEPGTFPLAHGAPARVGRLRAYGNAINAEAARAFIEACGVNS